MNLRDAKKLNDIARTIDSIINAFTPAGVNVKAIVDLYPRLTHASCEVKDMYARIIKEHPIIAIKIDEEPEVIKETIRVKYDVAPDNKDTTGE